jgi:hypothetical protein
MMTLSLPLHHTTYTPEAYTPDHRPVVSSEAAGAHELCIRATKGVGGQIPTVRNSSILHSE